MARLLPRLRRSAGIGLTLAFLAPAAHATNNNNVSIPLAGSVISSCYVADNTNGATTVFPDLTAGAVNILIGTIIEDCNAGYLVALTTTNNANFKGSVSGTLVPYTLAYSGVPVFFVRGFAIVTLNFRGTGKSGVSKPLTISFSPGYYVADSYSDTVTVTIVSK
ncbi:MAG TPA: hypothetical protein VGL83_21455 [Stellaceae bacterium]|jgi:hypothetical protein